MGPPHRVMQRGSRDAMPRARCHLEVSVFDIFILLFESETPKTEDGREDGRRGSAICESHHHDHGDDPVEPRLCSDAALLAGRASQLAWRSTRLLHWLKAEPIHLFYAMARSIEHW